MEIVKKNILSIICGVVALIALVALEFPLSGMYADTQAKLDAEKKIDGDLTRLKNIKRQWPVIPELETGAQTPLKLFPNEERIKAGLDIKQQVSDQAQKMKDSTGANNKRVLLVPGVLPNPRDPDLRFRFQRIYMDTVKDVLKKQLQGLTPPTDQDIHEAADKLYISDFQPKILNVGGKDVNKEQIVTDWLKACAGLGDKLRLEAARKAKVYIEPDWLTIQTQMLPANTAGPHETDIWYAQNMLWVQQDIVDAIDRINASAHDVTDAPVKHIFRIDVPDDSTQYAMSGPANGAATTASPTDAPGKAYNISPTGRVCNSLYDVVQFQLIMNVDARLMPAILAELQRQKLITVIQLDLLSVDGIEAAKEGYDYGDVPVVKLTIRGEELFLRNWTVDLMPDPIKTMLQVPPAAPATPGK